MSTSGRATVLIINYNGRPDLEEMLTSLESQTSDRFDSVFVDNASEDDSLSFVRERFPRVRVWAHSRNLGYARAANLGVRRFNTEYTIFLNTDIRMDPRCVEEILRAADADPGIACVAAKMRLYYQPDHLNGVGGAMNYLGYTWDRGMFEPDRGQYDRVEDVIFACGGAALVRRRPFLEAGGYDEGFYMYHEDVDLCWRFWLLGYRVVTAPQAVVYHKFSRSTRDNRGMAWRELIGERNSIRSMVKNYELRNLFRALRDLIREPQPEARKRELWRHLRWNLLHLPASLYHRVRIQLRRKRRDAEMAHLIDPSPEVPIDTSGFTDSEIRTFSPPS
jgi:GT2 family glycosyltransferase